MNEPGFLEDAKKARDLAAQEAVLAKNKCRDEAFAAHIRAGGAVADFQEPADAQQGVQDVSVAVLQVVAAEATWHQAQIPAAPACTKGALAGQKRPGSQRKKILVPTQVAVDKPAGWRESKKRKGEGGQPASKGVPGFKSLGEYKEKYRRLLMANGWGFGGKVMPKNSWTAWKEAVTTLMDMIAKQGLHQLTSGSNVGGSVGVDAGATSGVAAAAAGAADGEEMEEVDVNGEHEVGEEE